MARCKQIAVSRQPQVRRERYESAEDFSSYLKANVLSFSSTMSSLVPERCLLLEQGKTVQDVAVELGYSSASALIVMFQQQSGTTPERYRQRAGAR